MLRKVERQLQRATGLHVSDYTSHSDGYLSPVAAMVMRGFPATRLCSPETGDASFGSSEFSSDSGRGADLAAHYGSSDELCE